ncbi:UNVERIFIED_CONTAM: hypothetical protein PYX00_003179 [Menopon gallinae]|uniref:adenosylmethionine decarboxylase n=1 Tax=Menopon gallinae TaxID=328185 RepID=A0AAW2I192_9NEOP
MSQHNFVFEILHAEPQSNRFEGGEVRLNAYVNVIHIYNRHRVERKDSSIGSETEIIRQIHYGVACCGSRMAENDQNYFEGVEKLLELWFTRKDGNTENCDLRDIPRQKWEALLKIVHCEIISYSSNEHMDAYVLSESSMFVAQRRIILKTCGMTTPLKCLKTLMHVVYQMTGFDYIEDVFYSRKNFKRPDLQSSPHQHFEQEVELLDSFFADRGGSAYCFGAVNRSCWYLYTLNPLQTTYKRKKSEPDQTLEILMTNLDTRVMSIFTRLESSSAAQATRTAGIDKLLPSMVIDDYLFQPCGYSMNGISKNGSYMTIHVTPEPEFSYVSFETNVPQASYKDVIQRVINTFQPGNFVLTVFANEDSEASETIREVEKMCAFGHWKRQDVQYCKLKDYDLTYAFYSKFPS